MIFVDVTGIGCVVAQDGGTVEGMGFLTGSEGYYQGTKVVLNFEEAEETIC